MSNLIEVSQAFEVIRKAMAEDNTSEDSYAYVWHCNVARCCYDAMVNDTYVHSHTHHDDRHKIANDAASLFMSVFFGVGVKTKAESLPSGKCKEGDKL